MSHGNTPQSISHEKSVPAVGGSKRFRVCLVACVVLLALAAPEFHYGGRDELRVASVEATQVVRPAGGPKDDSSRDLKIEIEASHSFVCPADGTARLPLKVRGVSERCQPRYSWKVNGGVVEGEGGEVVWNLFGVRPQADKYYDAVVTVKTGPACGSRKAAAVWRACVVCPPGVTVRRTPPPPPPRFCPTISLGTRATATAGQNVPVTATLAGGTPGVKPKFKWTVLTGGRIEGRRDADSITVEAGKPGQTILAKVEVGGYGPGPPCSATSGIAVVAQPPVLKSIRLIPASASLRTGDQQRFTAQAFDQFGHTMAGVAINFESGDTHAATVGHIERDVARGSATATVTVHASGATQLIANGFAGANTATSDPALMTITASPSPTPTPATTPAPTTLRVSVTDIDGEQPIEGAQVVLMDDDINPALMFDRRTDESGAFELTGLPAGEYQLKVLAPGFIEQEKPITLEASQRLDESFRMALVRALPESPTPIPTPTPTPTPCADCDLCLISPHRCALPALLGLAALCVGAYFTLSGLTGAFATAAAGDRVHCTVFAPPAAKPSSMFLVQVFAHLAEQAALLKGMVMKQKAGAEEVGSQALDGVVKRGKRLTFVLDMPGLTLDCPERSLVWEGEPASVCFRVTVPKDCELTTIWGSVKVLNGSVPIGEVMFEFEVGEPAAPPAPVKQEYIPFRRAFVSYCHVDMEKVLEKVQMLEAEYDEVFMDKAGLKPGDDWQQKLYEYIDESDVFFLFWSSAAKYSKEVRKEWAYALERRQRDPKARPRLMPVPIEGPPVVKPPPPLKHLHFDSGYRYLVKAAQAATQTLPPKESRRSSPRTTPAKVSRSKKRS